MIVDYFTKEELEERRNKLLENIDDFSIVLLFSGVPKMETADEEYYFSVNRNFYYLSQIDQADSILLMVKTPVNSEKYLFIKQFDEKKERWTGKTLKKEEACQLSGLDNVLFRDTFKAKFKMILEELHANASKVNIYLDLEPEIKIDTEFSTNSAKQFLLDKYDFIEVKDVYGLIIGQRMVKSHAEIQHIKEAIRITRNALDEVMLNLRPGLYEYHLASVFEYSLRKQGNYYPSFNTIAAGGENATILHHPIPDGLLNDGECILFDLGCQYRHYCSDISRDYPINGKFDEKQKQIYQIVLDCNKYIISKIQPGITIKELQELTIKFFCEKLKEIELIKDDLEINEYYFHNVSHHLGLDTHDPSYREKPLEPGNIITVEPGLYIRQLKMGFRVEDDILVTVSGNINLSDSIIKEVKDIEKLMSTRK